MKHKKQDAPWHCHSASFLTYVPFIGSVIHRILIPFQAIGSIIVGSQYHRNQYGNILDIDTTDAVNIGILLDEGIRIVAKYLCNQGGNILDVNNVVTVHVTELAGLGLLKYLDVNDVGRVLHAINGVVYLDTDAPGEEGIKALGIGAIEVNRATIEVVTTIVNSVRNLGHVLIDVIALGCSIEGEDLVIIGVDAVAQICGIKVNAVNVHAG